MKMWPRVRTLDILCVLGPVWRYDLALQLKQQQIQWAPRIIQQQFVKLFSVRKTFGLFVSLEGDTKINSLLLVDISAFKVGRFTLSYYWIKQKHKNIFTFLFWDVLIVRNTTITRVIMRIN
ncbi:Hypothetical_protein [Hexamita inflata]|uniref:Hypothetical_protein n=1 Tax=Hexamita inflata TaxID=28002 RepID=A0AA86U6M4_9EUKA|nr:Hypothetical protein HINF_LOCUS32535 [Hexamita inflata]